MKVHWRKESQYADIVAMWRLAIVSSGFYSEDEVYGGISAKRAQLSDEISDDGDARVSSQDGSLRALYIMGSLLTPTT